MPVWLADRRKVPADRYLTLLLGYGESRKSLGTDCHRLNAASPSASFRRNSERILGNGMGLSFLRRAAALGAVSTLVAALPASAQDQPGTFLGRIIFGFGTPRVAIDTPQSVSTAEQEDIDRAQADTVGDVVADMPGVAVAGGDNPLGLAFNIRGIGLTEQPASEARIIVKVDGAPKFYEQYRMGSFFADVELFKRVEVLRGPASSTLHGSGALGGVVNFTTKDAADFLHGGDTDAVRAKVGFGTNAGSRLAGVIWAHDYGSFETLAALTYRTADDYASGDGSTVLATGGTSLSGLVKGTWTLGEDETLRLSFQQFRSSLDDAPLAATGGAGNVPVFGLIDRTVNDRTVVLSYQNGFPDNPALNLTAQLSYSDTTNSQRDHTDTSGGAVSCAPGSFAVVCDVDYAYKTLNLKLENRAEMAGAGWQNFLTYGIEVTRIDRQAVNSVGLLSFHPEGIDNKIGLYAQTEFVLGERLTVIPGIRADLVNRTPGPGIPGAEPVRDFALSPKVAVLYKLNDTISLFGSVARTERLPTLDELYSYSATQAPAISLERETSLNAELGFAIDRHDVLRAGDSLQLKLTAFQNRVGNLIQRTDAAQPAYFENVAAARFRGLELEAGYEAERFFGRLAWSKIDAWDTTYDYRLTSNPADRLVVTLGGRAPDRGLEYGWRGTFVDAITTASRSTTSGAITPTSYDRYVTHDLFLRWTPEDGQLGGFSLDIAVENLTDALYRNNLAADNGPGRTFKLSLSKTF